MDALVAKTFRQKHVIPRSEIVRDGIATTETLGHTGAATTPLQAVDDAVRRTKGVSVQFGSSSR